MAVTASTGNRNPAPARPGERRRTPGARKIRLKELPVFSRMIAAMLDAGIPLVQALQALEEQTTNKVFRGVIAGVRLRIEGGADFSEALSDYPDVFDQLYVSMMRAGEAGGLLSEIAARVAKYLEASAHLRRKIKSAMMYPLVVLSLAMLISMAMIIWLVPVFKDIYADVGKKLPGPTLFLLAMSDFLRKYFLGVFGGIVLGGIAFARFKRTDRGAYLWDSLLLRLPMINSLVQKIALGRFASTFAQLVSSGVPILESLDIVAVAIGNRVYGKIILDAKKVVESGEPLSAELTKHKIFPRLVIHMLSAGERIGKMDEMMRKVSDFYEDEVEATLAGLTSIIEPLLMVVLGVIIGGIVLGMFMPIFKLAEAITSG